MNRWMRWPLIGGLGAAFLIVAVALAPPAPKDRPPGGEVIDPWPLQPDWVELSCRAGRVFVTTPNGERYGANGSAAAIAPPTDAIQSHYDTSLIIRRGLALCETNSGPILIRRPEPRPDNGRQDEEPSLTVRQDKILGGHDYTLRVPVKGDPAAELTLSCGGDTPTLSFTTGTPPAVPPPLRGVTGAVTIDGRTSRSELAWFLEDRWSLRDAARMSKTVKAIAGAKRVGLRVPQEYSRSTTTEWLIPTHPSAEQLKRECDR